MKYLSKKQYRDFCFQMPILCVDGIICHNGKYLLVKRQNEPLKGVWWIPGGRVNKGETLEGALRRKMKEEVGLDVRIVARIGAYEEIYEKSDLDCSKHTVSVVFIAVPMEEPNVVLDSQSSEYEWADYLPKKFKQQVFKSNVH